MVGDVEAADSTDGGGSTPRYVTGYPSPPAPRRAFPPDEGFGLPGPLPVLT